MDYKDKIIPIRGKKPKQKHQYLRRKNILGFLMLAAFILLIYGLNVLNRTNKRFVADELVDANQCMLVVNGKFLSPFESAKKYGEGGDLVNAEKCYRVSVATAKKSKDYSLLRHSQVELGQRLRLQNKNKQAIAVLNEAAKIQDKYFPDDVVFLQYLNQQLALALRGNSQLNEALALLYGNETYLDQRNRGSSTLAATVYIDIGETLNQMDMNSKAQGYFTKAEYILQKNSSEKKLLARLWNALGILNSTDDNHKLALKYFLDALDVREKYFGHELYNIAEVKNNIGLSYESLGDYESALKFFTESESLYVKLYGNSNPDLLSVRSNMGICYLYLNNYISAKDSLESALNMAKSFLPQYHITTAKIHGNLSSVFGHLGQNILSCDHAKTAYNILEHSLGNAHKETKRAEKALAQFQCS